MTRSPDRQAKREAQWEELLLRFVTAEYPSAESPLLYCDSLQMFHDDFWRSMDWLDSLVSNPLSEVHS